MKTNLPERLDRFRFMPRKLNFIAVTLLVFAAVSFGRFASQAAEVVYKSYGDFCAAECAEMTYMKAYKSLYRNYAGRIEVEYDSSLPAEVVACIRIATDAVEQNILTVTPLRVKIGFKSFDIVEDESQVYSQLTETEVRYVYDEEAGICYPSSLYRQQHPVTTDEVIYDGTIYISEDEDWNCTHSTKKTINGRHDLTTYLMRAYMRILGIGSAIDRTDEGAVISLPAMTPYDYTISFLTDDEESRKVLLSSLDISDKTPSVDAAKVILSSPVAVLPDGTEITRYSGECAHNSFGLEYTLDRGLMMYAENENIMFQSVDHDIRAILNAIGWGAERIGYKHDWTGADLSYYLVNGEVSNWAGIWSSKDFTLESKEPLTVKESSLTLYYPMADGSGYRHAQTSTSYPWRFEYPTEADRAQCELNIHGCIYAYFVGYAIVENEAGEEFRLPLSYRASIGRPPMIVDARVAGWAPWLSCITVISGGTHAEIELLKDGNTIAGYNNYYSGQFVEYFDLPNFINGELIFSDIKVEYPVDIRISVTNDYGSDERIINVPSADFVGVETVAEESASWDSVELYGINGQYLGTFLTDDILEAYPAGLYILLYKSGHDIVKREKVCK